MRKDDLKPKLGIFGKSTLHAKVLSFLFLALDWSLMKSMVTSLYIWVWISNGLVQKTGGVLILILISLVYFTFDYKLLESFFIPSN